MNVDLSYKFMLILDKYSSMMITGTFRSLSSITSAIFFILLVYLLVFSKYLKEKAFIHRVNVTKMCYTAKDEQPMEDISTIACRNFSEKFPESFEENLNIVMNYPLTVKSSVLEMLKLDDASINILSKNISDSKIPVIVTAASANHFEEAQGLIEMLMMRYKGFKVIFYDIGLTTNQSLLMKRHCRCDFRTFPFENYPEYFRILINYTWKPLILQLVFMEYDFVMWMDSSIRLNGSPLGKFFAHARKTDIKVLRGTGIIVRQTHLNTFKALGETPCLFQRREVQAGWIILSRTKFILRAVMRPWVSCALQYGCMAQDNAEYHRKGRSRRIPENHLCHRFDQSVMSIILTRLFNDRMESVLLPIERIGAIMRNDKSHYLEMLDGKW